MIWKLTSREQTRWQLDATRALVDLLRAALKADLPMVRWNVDGLRIVGQIIRSDRDRDGDEYLEGDGLEPRDVFNRWCDFLHAEKRHETPAGTRIHLRGEGKVPGHDRVTVIVIGDIDQEEQQ